MAEISVPSISMSDTRTRWTNILPIVFVMYTISYFDRSNIGLALPFIVKELHLDAFQAGIIGGAFTWGYAITQFTAGWFILKFGTRNVIGVALWLWGLAAVGTAMVTSYEQLIVARIFLGLVEGPVFAATAAFLSDWFAKEERGRAFGIWNLSSPTGAFLAGPLSGLILAHYDWRFMMIAEGLPAWIWAVLWWWRIPKSVTSARWLPSAERAALHGALAKEQEELKAKDKSASAKWWTIFSEPAVWFTFFGALGISQLIAGYQVWLPSLLRETGSMSIETIGILSGLPFLAGMAGIFVITQHSDKHGQERRWHAAIPTMITGVLLILAMALPVNLVVAQIVLLIVAGFFMKMFLPLIFTRLTETLPHSKAVAAVVFVNALGNLVGGTCGPLIIGAIKLATHSYDFAFMALGAGALVGGVLLACVGARWTMTRAQRASLAK